VIDNHPSLAKLAKRAFRREIFEWVVGCTYRGLSENAAAVRNRIGCYMSFRLELGRMREYTAGDEETELCIRSSQKILGRALLYAPAARVRHQATPERASWRSLLRRCYFEGLSVVQLARWESARDGLASE
jgi:hypothetical protein